MDSLRKLLTPRRKSTRHSPYSRPAKDTESPLRKSLGLLNPFRAFKADIDEGRSYDNESSEGNTPVLDSVEDFIHSPTTPSGVAVAPRTEIQSVANAVNESFTIGRPSVSSEVLDREEIEQVSASVGASTSIASGQPSPVKVAYAALAERITKKGDSPLSKTEATEWKQIITQLTDKNDMEESVDDRMQLSDLDQPRKPYRFQSLLPPRSSGNATNESSYHRKRRLQQEANGGVKRIVKVQRRPIRYFGSGWGTTNHRLIPLSSNWSTKQELCPDLFKPPGSTEELISSGPSTKRQRTDAWQAVDSPAQAERAVSIGAGRRTDAWQAVDSPAQAEMKRAVSIGGEPGITKAAKAILTGLDRDDVIPPPTNSVGLYAVPVPLSNPYEKQEKRHKAAIGVSKTAEARGFVAPDEVQGKGFAAEQTVVKARQPDASKEASAVAKQKDTSAHGKAVAAPAAVVSFSEPKETSLVAEQGSQAAVKSAPVANFGASSTVLHPTVTRSATVAASRLSEAPHLFSSPFPRPSADMSLAAKTGAKLPETPKTFTRLFKEPAQQKAQPSSSVTGIVSGDDTVSRPKFKPPSLLGPTLDFEVTNVATATPSIRKTLQQPPETVSTPMIFDSDTRSESGISSNTERIGRTPEEIIREAQAMEDSCLPTFSFASTSSSHLAQSPLWKAATESVDHSNPNFKVFSFAQGIGSSAEMAEKHAAGNERDDSTGLGGFSGAHNSALGGESSTPISAKADPRRIFQFGASQEPEAAGLPSSTPAKHTACDSGPSLSEAANGASKMSGTRDRVPPMAAALGGPRAPPDGSGQRPFDYSAAGLAKPSSRGWKCPTCDVNNKNDAVKCISCETAKPAAGPSPASAAQPMTFNFAAAGFKPPQSSGWKCGVCGVDNATDATNCASCEGSNPKAASANATSSVAGESKSTDGATASFQSPNTGFNFAAAGFKPPVSLGWKCAVCGVDNATDATKCASCEGSNPNAASTAASASVAGESKSSDAAPLAAFKAPVSGFNFAAAGFKPPQRSGWECGACGVSNKVESEKCIACETPAAEPKQASGKPSVATSPFSVTSSKESTNTPVGFKFGGQLVGAGFGGKSETPGTAFGGSSGGFIPPQPINGGFNFGGHLMGAKEGNTAFGGFAPPNTSESSSANKAETNGAAFAVGPPAAPVGGFVFGGQKMGGSVEAKKDVAKEEANSSTTAARPPAAPVGGFVFGGQKMGGSMGAKKDDGKEEAKSSTTGTADKADGPGVNKSRPSPFGFGSTATPGTVQPQKPVFNFGHTSAESGSGSGFGSAASKSVTETAGFGASDFIPFATPSSSPNRFGNVGFAFAAPPSTADEQMDEAGGDTKE
ncbi:hypothetical protein HK104_010928 [Borealophlyctis nickersoniae]|nr:hypothetical protein HK104_010928 [Borealophlyctis nickersoniae]